MKEMIEKLTAQLAKSADGWTLEDRGPLGYTLQHAHGSAFLILPGQDADATGELVLHPICEADGDAYMHLGSEIFSVIPSDEETPAIMDAIGDYIRNPRPTPFFDVA